MSAPTLALKSPRRTSCSELGMVKIVDERISQNSSYASGVANNIGRYTLIRENEPSNVFRRPSTNQQPTTWRGHASFAIPIGVDTTREAAVTGNKSLLNWRRGGRQGLLPTVEEGGASSIYKP